MSDHEKPQTDTCPPHRLAATKPDGTGGESASLPSVAPTDAYTRGWNDAKEAAEQVVHAARGSGNNDLRTVAYRIKSLTPKPSPESGSQ